MLKVIIRITNEKDHYIISDDGRTVMAHLVSGEKIGLGDLKDFASMGLEPEALIGLDLEEAEQLLALLGHAINIRKALFEQGWIKKTINVAPFFIRNPFSHEEE
jgi:hypothetical protein